MLHPWPNPFAGAGLSMQVATVAYATGSLIAPGFVDVSVLEDAPVLPVGGVLRPPRFRGSLVRAIAMWAADSQIVIAISGSHPANFLTSAKLPGLAQTLLTSAASHGTDYYGKDTIWIWTGLPSTVLTDGRVLLR